MQTPETGNLNLAFAKYSLRSYENHKLAFYILKDTSYFFALFLAFSMHYFRDENDDKSGITTNSFRKKCQEYGLLGPRRVLSMILALRTFGVLRIVPSEVDWRYRRMEPTDKGRELLNDLFLNYGKVLAPILDGYPVGEFIKENSNGSIAMAAHCHKSHFRIHGNHPAVIFNDYKVYFQGHANKILLFAYANRDENDELKTSFSHISRTLGVSRSHVQKVFAAAEEQGLLVQESPGGKLIQLSPELIRLKDKSMALYVSMFSNAIKNAIDEHRQV